MLGKSSVGVPVQTHALLASGCEILHLLRALSCEGSVASSKASSSSESPIRRFLFQNPVHLLSLKIIQYLLTSSSSSSRLLSFIFPFITTFRMQFLRNI